MSERFERLYKLEEDLYCIGSPIIVSFGQLLKDTTTDNIVAQLKLHSISNKTIIAAKVSICAFDVFEKELQGVTDYQYLDLKIANGQYFGADKAILIPDTKTRRFDIDGISIVFSDHTIWEWTNETNLKPIPKSNRIENQLKNTDLINQYRIMTTEQAVCTPEVYENLWICTCGEINNDFICTNCKCSKKKVFEYFNVENLSLYLEERLLKEQQERKERENLAKMQREAEEKAKQENITKNKKRIKFISVITLVVAAVSIVLSILISHIKYNNAIAEIEKHINDCNYEYAFDLVIGEEIKNPEKQTYLDKIIPEMKKQFEIPKEDNTVLFGDDFKVVVNGKTIHLEKDSETKEIYTVPKDTKQYTSGDWTGGSRYWLQEEYMYGGGYIIFAEVCDTMVLDNSSLGWHIDIDTRIKVYDIEKDICRTIASDVGVTCFVKLLDGRIILDTNGTVFNPFTEEIIEKTDLVSKENDSYPYKYSYKEDYIYKTE